MTNHVHMAIQAGTDPLARFMAFLASNYARFVNRKTGRPGHLFERRYRAILVQQHSYLKELLRYIHMNPMRAHMVEDLADYPWSSHHAYLQEAGAPWLTVDCLLQLFGATLPAARHCYSQFIGQEQSAAMLGLLRQGAAEDDRLIGDDAWVKTVLGKQNSLGMKTTLDELVQGACQRHNVTESMLSSSSRKRAYSNIRAEIALAATEQRIASVTEVARRFGRAHSGLSRAMNRMRDSAK
jgi:hypothetical protein